VSHQPIVHVSGVMFVDVGLLRFRSKLSSEALNPFMNLIGPMDVEGVCLCNSNWSRVLLQKPTGSQLVKKFPAFFGTRRFITAFTSVRHLSLS